MDYATARLNMIEGQLRPNGVVDLALIGVMSELPREVFVPKPLRGIAYIDEDLHLGGGRYLTEPRILGRMLQAAGLKGSDIVLDIGCATGYSSAVLARLTNTVVALESDAGLAAHARSVLGTLGIDNVAVVEGPLERGWPDQGTYDVIVFGGSVPQVPQSIIDQLAEDGRLVTVVKRGPGLGQARLYTRLGGVVSARDLFDAATPTLPGFAAEQSFTF
jgi:protein-L-isoaspartate(D-aspartate) O-methyltransferase